MAANPDHDPARDRIGHILRAAWDEPEAAAIEDETSRLMLHLAVQPYEAVPPVAPGRQEAVRDLPAAEPQRGRRSLIRRVFGRG